MPQVECDANSDSVLSSGYSTRATNTYYVDICYSSNLLKLSIKHVRIEQA